MPTDSRWDWLGKLCVYALGTTFWAICFHSSCTSAIVELHEFVREGSRDTASEFVQFAGAAVISLVLMCTWLYKLIKTR